MITADKIHAGVSVEVDGTVEELKEEYTGILKALLNVEGLRPMVLTTTLIVFRDRFDPDGKIFDEATKIMTDKENK